jgi:hypothetical protein
VGGVKHNAWMIAGAAVAVLIVAVYLRLGRAPGSPDLSPLVNRGQPTAPGSPARPMASPTPGAQAPPSPEPGLDQELSVIYRKALEGQGIRVLGLAITDQRARGGARRADILYQTTTDGRIASLRPEIVRIISPGANPQLALDTITVRAAKSNGIVTVAVSVTVPEVDRWLKGQMPDDEFYARWIVRVPSR